ncbi:MAG: DUF3108 domain-containing protein [Bacteroidales bacterium]|nr:DUF3108 domain-containing protein [Bacteroidales bacterium]
MNTIKTYTYSLVVIAVMLFDPVNAQEKINMQGNNKVFQPGEQITYVVSYNWFILWTEVGEVHFEVKNKELLGKPVYHITGYGATYKSWDWFYKVRDKYESFVDPVTLQPYIFDRDIQEGNYSFRLHYIFNHKDTTVYSTYVRNDKKIEYDTIKSEPSAFDVLTTLYYARNINFSKFKINDTIPVTVFLDREVYHLYFRYLGTEQIKLKRHEVYNCIKFSVLLVEGTLFKGGEDMMVWVTNDKNRIPVYLESPILVGSVQVRLKSYSGLKFPLTAKVKD